MTSLPSQALAGIRIVDFSHVLAGPIATHFLCQQGADVVKVESASGDTMRNYGGETFADGMGPSFVSVNTGKRSIVLDLKLPDHLDVARRLVAGADVVVENFRPGVMDRLGLGYDACRALQPRVVFCSISGFGQSGPLRENPAIDQIIQSMSGLMELSGEPGSAPMRVGFPIVDTFTGLLSSFAITSALLQRQRTGQGQLIDVAMLDAALVMMVAVAGPYLVAGVPPRKTGNIGYSKSPTSDNFPTAEGDLTIGVVRQSQFQDLCRVIGRLDLLTDPRFADRKQRQHNGASLRQEVIAALAAAPALDWERRLNAAGVAAAAVRTVPEALALEHVRQRQLTQAANLAHNPQALVFKTGFQFAHGAPGVQQPAPQLGQHTRQVLQELGYAAQDIERIVALPAAPAARAG